jgi:class 3 adenylate cyclase
MNARMGMRQALARTQLATAELLLERDGRAERPRCVELVNRALDTARDLGMQLLVERALATKLRLQGIAQHGVAASIDAVVSLVERERPDLRPHAAPDGTVTILFTDIEGSTEMTERLGDRRWLEVLHAHNAIVRRELARWGGFEVKAQGDGFMVAFASARRALDCAVAIQRACRAWADRHPETPIRVRMGLHTGEAIKEAEDFFGRAVIQAARITAEAAGGEILASSLVRQLTEGAGEIAFGAPREVQLKGFTGTNQVCPVAW